MRAVNLLPERPRSARSFAGGRRPLVALGAAAVIAGAGWWGWSASQAADAVREEVAVATVERDELQGRLGAYQAAEARLAAVRARRGEVAALGAGRTNWERLVRDLAAVMPRTIWLTNLKGELGGPTPPGAAAAAPGVTASAPVGIHLDGFAPDQRTVALVMARAATVRGLGEPYLSTSEIGTEGGRSLVHFVIDIPVDQRAQDRATLTPVAATATEATP